MQGVSFRQPCLVHQSVTGGELCAKHWNPGSTNHLGLRFPIPMMHGCPAAGTTDPEGRGGGRHVCHTDETWIVVVSTSTQWNKHAKLRDRFSDVSPALRSQSVPQFSYILCVRHCRTLRESYPLFCEDYELWLRVTSRYEVTLISEKLRN